MWLYDVVSVDRQNGSAGTLQGFMVDISERKRLEAELLRSEAQRKSMLDHAPDAMMLVDRDGTISYVNKQFTLLFGYTSPEILGKKVEQLIPAGLRDGHVQLRQSYQEKPDVRAMSRRPELAGLRKDGSEFPVEISLSPLPGEADGHTCCAIRDVTEQRRIERALRSEMANFREDSSILVERMALAVKASSLGIWEWDLEENLMIWDSRMSEIFGVEKKVPTPYDEWAGLIHPDDLPAAEASLQTAIDAKAQAHMEYRIIRPDGELRYIYSASTVLQDPAGAAPRVVGICKDITETKKSEINLQEVYEYLDTILLNMPVGVAIVEGPEFRYFRINRVLADFNGLDVKDHLGRPLKEVLPEAAVNILPRLQKVLESGIPSGDFEFSVSLPKNPGEIRHLVDSFFPISGDDGVVRAVGVIVRDVTEDKRVAQQLKQAMQDLDLANQDLAEKVRTRTAKLEAEISERKRAEAALRERESQLELLLSSTAEAIYGINLKGQCTFANSACIEMLGHAKLSDLLGQNMHDLIHHTYADGTPYPESECRIFKAFRIDQGTHVDDEVLWRKDGTSFPAEYWSYPIREGGVAIGSVVTFLDISDRVRAEAETTALRNQLAHTSRVTALGELAASLAHELNQPLSAVVSNAQAATRLLSRAEPDMNEALEALTDIASDGMRAGNVIRRLRSLLRGDEAELKPVKINHVITEVIDLVHSESVIQNIQTELDLCPDIPLVLGDRTQLQQVLLNLVLNAGEAMRQNENKNRRLTICSSVEEGSTVTVNVSDTGPGINQDHFNQIFEPFFTTKSSGLGMGLSINRTIIESFGGRIWAENALGGGAKISFSLPVHTEEEP